MMSDSEPEHLSRWSAYSHLYEKLEIPPKTILLREGQISKTAFYIQQGCLRSWFNHSGKQVTFQFFFEGEGVSSIESFRTHQPSLFNIESIEPCTLWSISRKNFEYILTQDQELKDAVESHIFQRLIVYQQLFLSRIRDNPQTRYEDLLRQKPKILMRVPQHYIASYLGITPVSLSRIRNRK